jgi:hypothetical protein
VALHPNGMLLLAGFSDKLRLMTVLMDDLRFTFVCSDLHHWNEDAAKEGPNILFCVPKTTDCVLLLCRQDAADDHPRGRSHVLNMYHHKTRTLYVWLQYKVQMTYCACQI